jgi:hypothetical protein
MAGKRKNIIGNKYGLLTVVKYSHADHRRKSNYLCKCDCGEEVVVRQDRLTIGDKIDCGCINRNPPGNKSKSWKGYKEIPQAFWYRCQNGAEVREIEFKITIEYAWTLFLKQKRKCALTGKELKFDSRNKVKDGTVSLDRIDSSKGYIKGNVQWVDKWINLMKLDFSEEEFIQKCKEVVNYKCQNLMT